MRGIPKFQVDSNKIFCEFFSNDRKEIDVDKKQSVYILYCHNTTISVKGKASTIILGKKNAKNKIGEKSAWKYEGKQGIATGFVFLVFLIFFRRMHLLQN